jgi:translocation and assembly module TamB
LRVLRAIAVTLGVVLTIVFCVVSGVLLHLDLPSARGFAVRELNDILARPFKGQITVDRLAHLSIFGVKGADATVTAADGTKVIVAKGISVQIALLALVKRALFAKGDLRIGVASIAVEAIEANLDSQPDGSLKLLGAFDLRTPLPPAKPGAHGTEIELQDISVQHTWVHGAIVGAPPLDADIDMLKASLLTATNVTKLDVPHFTFIARGLPRGITPHGVIAAHVAMPSASGRSVGLRGALIGGIGDIPMTTAVTMDGDALDAVLDVPEVSAAKIQASIDDVPIYEPVSAHGEVHGDLSNLKTTLRAKLGRGSLDVDASVVAKGPLGGRATIIAKDLDARTFVQNGPATDVGITILASAESKPNQGIFGHASIDIPIGMAVGQRVPHTTLSVDVAQLAQNKGPVTLSGHLEGIVDEPGAPLVLTADARSQAGVSTVNVAAKVHIPHLADVKRVANLGTGKAELTIAAHAKLSPSITFTTQVDATVEAFEHGGAHVDRLTFAGKARGSLAKPDLEARVVANGISASGYKFSWLEMEVAGGLANARIAVRGKGVNTPDLTANGEVALAHGVHVQGLALGLKRGERALMAKVDSVRIEGGSIEASGIDVEGVGEALQGSFKVAPGSLAIKAKSLGLDLSALGYLAGQDKKIGGNLALYVDVDARKDHAKGKVAIDLTHGDLSAVHGGEAHVALDLDERHLTGDLHAALGDVGSFELLDMDVHIGGQGALDAHSWRSAWGKAAVSADVDLARVAAILPPSSLQVSDLTGRLLLDGQIARDSVADVTPEVRLSFRTQALTASGQATPPVRKPGGPLMAGPPTWTLNGLDVDADLVIHGNDSSGELSLRVIDELGGLVALDVKTAPLPFGAMFGGVQAGKLVGQLERLPILVRMDVPRRDLDKLPPLIRPQGVAGVVEATLAMTGSSIAPRVELSVQTHALSFSAVPNTPIDGGVTGEYDGVLGHLRGELRSSTGILAKGDVEVHARVEDLIAGSGAKAQWGASVNAEMARFPLGAISMLSDDQVRGFASGKFSLIGLHDHAQAKVSVALDDLKVGKARFTKGNVDVTLDDHGLDAKARLEAPEGFMEAFAKMGMKWGRELAPASDGTGLEATLRAKHFSADAIAPFVSGDISRLSGWIDADAKVSLVPDRKPSMSGSMAFSEGTIQAPLIGEEFHGVKARVTLSPDGFVKVEDVEARGLSGRLTASGAAHLDGATLLGADLAVAIRKGEGIPLDIQGLNLGSVYGDVTVKATGASDGKSIHVAINVPHFHVDLPDVGFPRSPQELGDAPSVHVGVFRTPDRFIVLPMSGATAKLVAERNVAVQPPLSAGEIAPGTLVTPPTGQTESANESFPSRLLDVAVHIGDVQVLRGKQLTIDLDGNVSAKVGAATVVRGEIYLKSGQLNVQSKEFAIEKGTISFVGDDPGNPEVNVTAGWTAPDGTRIYADYVGPVKTGKVNLRSEPPHPKNEIVSLILFGTADGSSATPYASKSPSTGTQAGTAVGGLATDGLSKGLDQLTGMNVTTKIDTSDSANPRPEVEMQIAKDISLELAFVLGTPPPGTNPDTSYATINWRFVRNWSLETTFGDYGSSLADIVWHYRY